MNLRATPVTLHVVLAFCLQLVRFSPLPRTNAVNTEIERLGIFLQNIVLQL